MTKTEIKWFSISQYDVEQKYLRDMHVSGWKLTHITFPFFYHFEKCMPEDMVYQLDYNQEGTAHKKEYIQMFTDCGWEYLFDFVGYSYFRKPVSQMEGPEEIFCDDESRLEMMKRIFKGRLTPMIYVFFCIILPQLFLLSSKFYTYSLYKILTIFYILLFVLYLAVFVSFGTQFFSYEKKIKEPDKSFKIKYGSLGIITIIICAFVVYVCIMTFLTP